MIDNTKLDSLISQIPDIRKKLKQISGGGFTVKTIYKDPDFIAWKNKILVEFDNIPSTPSIVEIRNTFSRINGRRDDVEFENVASLLTAMVDREKENIGIDEMKLKTGTEVFSAFNQYRLIKQVGSGGNGKVWSATDKDGENVAIKFLERENSEKVLKRFKNETFFCMTHKHPNLLPVLDYGTAGSNYIFYVMPLYAQTLRDRIKEGIPYDDIPKIFTGILSGLAYAHKAGSIHRDIKPENILFSDNGLEPIIADFGIAHFSEENLATVIETKRTDRMANFQYAAPEQRKKGGQASAQTDIYAVGLILNEMFTGEIPQASDYKKIGEIAPAYAYLDDLFSQLFKQDPIERLYPEEQIIAEMQALATKQKDLAEIVRLRELSISMQRPEDYNPAVVAITYENSKLVFKLDCPVKSDWFKIIAYGSYSHSAVMGYETNRLQQYGNDSLAMPMRLDEQKATIKNVVDYVKDWICMANGIYKNAIRQQLENEQRLREQQRIEEIRRKENAVEMQDFLSSLQ